jgi:hypothetical protein
MTQNAMPLRTAAEVDNAAATMVLSATQDHYLLAAIRPSPLHAVAAAAGVGFILAMLAR